MLSINHGDSESVPHIYFSSFALFNTLPYNHKNVLSYSPNFRLFVIAHKSVKMIIGCEVAVFPLLITNNASSQLLYVLKISWIAHSKPGLNHILINIPWFHKSVTTFKVFCCTSSNLFQSLLKELLLPNIPIEYRAFPSISPAVNIHRYAVVAAVCHFLFMLSVMAWSALKASGSSFESFDDHFVGLFLVAHIDDSELENFCIVSIISLLNFIYLSRYGDGFTQAGQDDWSGSVFLLFWVVSFSAYTYLWLIRSNELCDDSEKILIHRMIDILYIVVRVTLNMSPFILVSYDLERLIIDQML